MRWVSFVKSAIKWPSWSQEESLKKARYLMFSQNHSIRQRKTLFAQWLMIKFQQVYDAFWNKGRKKRESTKLNLLVNLQGNHFCLSLLENLTSTLMFSLETSQKFKTHHSGA